VVSEFENSCKPRRIFLDKFQTLETWVGLWTWSTNQYLTNGLLANSESGLINSHSNDTLSFDTNFKVIGQHRDQKVSFMGKGSTREFWKWTQKLLQNLNASFGINFKILKRHGWPMRPAIIVLFAVQQRLTHEFSQLTRKLLVKILIHCAKVGGPTSRTCITLILYG